MESLTVVACALFGLLAGSFANVVVHRVPAGVSIVRPGSSCPACAAPVRPIDNVPLASWIALNGRCRTCRTVIPVRYPLVEAACAALFAAVAAQIGPSWQLPAFLLFAWTLLVVAVIDTRTRRIPNRLTYPLTPALAALLVAAALLEGNPGLGLRALLGGLCAFAVLLGLALISPRGMGMGDVKLAAFIGMGLGYLGWSELVAGLFGAFLLGGIVALVLVLLRRRGRRDQLPFGPYLSAAALATVLTGNAVADAYLRLVGLA